MSDHGAQLRWKDQLGANPNPPCQHSMWEETGVPWENPRISVEHWLSLLTWMSRSSPKREPSPRSQRRKALAITIATPPLTQFLLSNYFLIHGIFVTPKILQYKKMKFLIYCIIELERVGHVGVWETSILRWEIKRLRWNMPWDI